MSYGTDGLTFNTLRGANVARLPTFKNKHGELAHSKPDGSDWSPAQWLQAVIGELGEFANVRKKYERGDLSAAEYETAAAKELADVQTYLDILALRCLDAPDGTPHKHGVNLGRATTAKFNEVSVRVDSPVYIGSDGDWHLRSPGDLSWKREASGGLFRLDAPLERDALGYGTHPDLEQFMVDPSNGALSEAESEIIVLSETLLNAAGFESSCRAMTDDLADDEPVNRGYFEQGDPNCAGWTPASPAGDGWRLAAVYDTDEGPRSLFVRPLEQWREGGAT